MAASSIALANSRQAAFHPNIRHEPTKERRLQGGLSASLHEPSFSTRAILPGPDSFSYAFGHVREHANITYTEADGLTRTKHVHDLRGTSCTKLIKQGLSDQEVAEVMGWSPDQVRGIRRSYVDPQQIVMAIGERLRDGL